MKDGAVLGDAYGATLERIMAQGKEKIELAMATLTWVCYSERPLLEDELCNALAVEIGIEDFDPENIPPIATLLDCCQGLITVEKKALTVRLIHYTVQEYLCNHPDLFSKPHSILAETCLTYLNSQQFKNLPSHPPSDHHSTLFLNYSSRYWGIHARRELSDRARALALELLSQYEGHISAVSLLEQVIRPSDFEGIGAAWRFSGLHCASFFGIVELVSVLIDVEGHRINQPDGGGSTPLSWATENGHEGVVRLLLERSDVDPNGQDVNDRSPLVYAALEGHEGVVKLLLEREDIDPNRPDVNDRTPLGYAAVKGYEGVVRLLLERGDVDPNRQGVNDRPPLVYAALEGHEGVVKLLLEREDIDPNRPDVNNRTPLGYAAVKGYEGVVRLLLERGDVDPNHQDANDRTPLGGAAINGHEGVVKLLLGREDVDPSRPDKHGSTPLTHAARTGHGRIVELLQARISVGGAGT